MRAGLRRPRRAAHDARDRGTQRRAHHRAVFSRLLPDTPQKYLGLYNDDDAADSREAALRNHLMVRRNYEALVSGDGACAGCGEKSILRAARLASPRPTCGRSITRRPTACAPRPRAWKGGRRQSSRRSRPRRRGGVRSSSARPSPTSSSASAARTTRTPPSASPITRRSTAPITDEQIVDGLAAVLRQDAFNHKDLQAIDGRRANGMSVMMMGASTGCNTVYGSTPPDNPHPYPWMNSLFQDGATISLAHGRSVHRESRPPLRRPRAPGRRAARPRPRTSLTEADYFTLTHLDDALMTDQEIRELPEGLGRRRRRRARRHRLPERLEGHPAKPAEREDADARHAGLLQHRRPELRLAPRCSAATT